MTYFFHWQATSYLRSSFGFLIIWSSIIWILPWNNLKFRCLFFNGHAKTLKVAWKKYIRNWNAALMLLLQNLEVIKIPKLQFLQLWALINVQPQINMGSGFSKSRLFQLFWVCSLACETPRNSSDRFSSPVPLEKFSVPAR